MIKFTNLEKACKKLDFTLSREDPFFIVSNWIGKDVIFLSKHDPWSIGFYANFDWLSAEEKAMLIKAITKDYDDYINED